MKPSCKIIFIVTLFNLLSMSSYSQQIKYGNNAKAGHYHHINGIRLYCEQYGTGEPLVLLHGNGGSMEAFYKNIPYLAGKFRVIAIDSRAQGKSVDAGDSLSFEMMADDVSVLLDTLRIPSAYVLGWSDGGIVALVMAMRHPAKVKKLAATGANLFVDATVFKPGDYDEMMQGYNQYKDSARNTPAARNGWKVAVLDVFQPTYSFNDLKSISCPSLIIAGDRDVISLEHTVGIFQHVPGARLWIVPNSGHATLQEHTDEFDALVSNFFLEKDKKPAEQLR